ncbi:hypothetical protein VNI00_006482 [Paramarasmius palmivorus]|uniref:C2H2-type domain-containing protein n=1 Tax=Paramarasmius palmivorus TaxID=297713 RepID=A0AAW0D9U0_9AGAR
METNEESFQMAIYGLLPSSSRIRGTATASPFSDLSPSSEHVVPPTPSDSSSNETTSPVEPYPASDTEESDEVRDARRRKKGKCKAVDDIGDTKEEGRQCEEEGAHEEEDALYFFSFFRSLTEASDRVGESSICPSEENTEPTLQQDLPCANSGNTSDSDSNAAAVEPIKTLNGYAQTAVLLASNVAKNDSRLARCMEIDFGWLLNIALNLILELMGQSDESSMYTVWDLRPVGMGGLVPNEVYDYKSFILHGGEAGFYVVKDAFEAAQSWEVQGYLDIEFLTGVLQERTPTLPSDLEDPNGPRPEDSSACIHIGDQNQMAKPSFTHEPAVDSQNVGRATGIDEGIYNAPSYDRAFVAQQPSTVQAPSSQAAAIRPQESQTQQSQVLPETNFTFQYTLVPTPAASTGTNVSVPTRGKKRTVHEDLQPETVRCRYRSEHGNWICNQVYGCRDALFRHMTTAHKAFELQNGRTHCRFVREGTNTLCENNHGKGYANRVKGLRDHLNAHYDNQATAPSQSAKRSRRV